VAVAYSQISIRFMQVAQPLAPPALQDRKSRQSESCEQGCAQK
jgi:hypothetical protein